MKLTKTKIKQNRLAITTTLAILIQLVAPFFMIEVAHAGTLTNTFVRFDRMKVSTATTGTVCAKPATAGTAVQVQVTFPTGYTVAAAANWTVSTTNLAWPTGGTAWPGIGTASTVAGQVVTFPSGTPLTVGTLYCFNWINSAALTVTGTAGSSLSGTVTTQATGPATIDSNTFATAAIANDQIVVSATVAQNFSFALSGNTDALGALLTSAVASSPTPRTATVNTNAPNGWLAWAADLNTGLLSSTAPAYTIASTGVGAASQALVAGTEGYNMGVAVAQTSGSASPVVNANFDKAGVANKGGGLDTTLRTITTSTGTANGAVMTLTNFAAINSATKAATDYADTITVVAAGLF